MEYDSIFQECFDSSVVNTNEERLYVVAGSFNDHDRVTVGAVLVDGHGT